MTTPPQDRAAPAWHRRRTSSSPPFSRPVVGKEVHGLRGGGGETELLLDRPRAAGRRDEEKGQGLRSSRPPEELEIEDSVLAG